MATPAGRPSYAGWLDQIAQQGRTDDFGMVAAAWWTARDHGRPRLSAVASVNRWISEHPPPGVANLNQALHQLQLAYQSANGLPEQVAAPGHQQAAQPAPPMPTFQEPVPGSPVPPPPQQPVQPAVPPPPQPGQVTAGQEPVQGAGQQPGQVPEHPWQVIMLALGRIEARLDELAPLAALGREVMAAEPMMAPSEAQERALAIAAQQGWTQGPAFEDAPVGPPPPPPGQPLNGRDFYRGAVPPPDYAQMAADVETADAMQPGAIEDWPDE